MLPSTNQIHRTQSKFLTHRFAMRSTPFVMVSLVCCVVAAMYAGSDSVKSKAALTVQASGRGKPYFNFRDGQEMQLTYRGERTATEALRTGQAQPRSLASTDLDGDAAPDLVAGYGYGGTGIVTIQRGNPDAFAPKDEAVFARMQQGYNPDSLLPGAEVLQVPEPVDFLYAGSFNHDSMKDVLLAARGGGLYLLRGDGQGGLGTPEAISLPGVVTALTVGEFQAADGWSDVAVGITGPAGSEVLVFDGAAGGFDSEALRFPLAAPATAVQFGELDSDPFMDLAVATGGQVEMVHGWGRKQNPSLQSRVERVDAGSGVRGLSMGFFIWNREAKKQLATFSDDGTIRILQRGEENEQRFSDEEIAVRARARANQRRDPAGFDIEEAPSWRPASAESWTTSREIAAAGIVTDTNSQNSLLSSHISPHGTDDLLVVGGNERSLQIIHQADTNAKDGLFVESPKSLGNAGDLVSVNLDTTDAPVAVLALPQKLNGERSVVIVQAQSAQPTIVPLAPTATITVDRTDDVIAAACTAAVNDCSLRGAVQFANGAPGTTISLPAGTYTLTINGAGGCTKGGESNSNGDLEINTSTTITGVGSATTIIRQLGTGNVTFPGDRVMCLNVPFTIGLNYNFSGLTITGGRDTTSLAQAVGGGGLVGGAKDNTLSLTDVTISNNQATGVGNFGGGGIQITGGSLTITNCSIGGANAPGANRSDVTLANSEVQSGGGLTYTPGDPIGQIPSPGTLTITGTTFNRNTAASGAAGGGGADLLTSNQGTGSVSISTSTFSNNQASVANGGGIIVESIATTVATTALNTNSAGARGGGIYVGGGSLLLDGTTPSITFTGNTATTAGSSISAASAVNVSGTNTTLGGDLEVTTNGVWTNNAGSTISPTNFIISGTGSFTGNNSTTNVGGNFQFASGTFNAGTGLFNFNGSGAQSITNTSSITFNNLTDSNTTQPFTLNNSFAVNGTLNVNGASAIFAPVAGAVISGTGTLTGTGTARVTRTGADAFFSQYTITNKTLTNLTVEYIGAAAQTASTTTYGNLKINNGSGVTLGAGTTTVNGTLTLTTGVLGVGTNTLVINNGTSVGTGSLTSAATGTVNYNQGSPGQNVLAANYGNLTFSAFTKVLASSGIIGIAGTFNTGGIASGHTITGSTIDFNGTGAQSVPAFNFNNLTISGARTTNSVTLVNGGTIGIAGTFSPTASFSSGNYITTNNTVDFNGAGAQTISAFNYNNLTSSNTGARTLASSGTIGIAGVFTQGTNAYTITGSTINFNGSGAQTIPAFNYNNLTSSSTGARTLASSGTVGVAGAFTPGTNVYTITGSTVDFNGAGAQTISAFNYNNLTSSNTGARTLASSGTIGIANVFTPGTNVYTITGSTIDFNGTGAQTVPAFNYNNLTISGARTGANSVTLANGGTIGIAGTFSPTATFGTGNFVITNNTIDFNGTGAQTIPALGTVGYNNLTISGARTTNSVTLVNGGTIAIAGVFSPTATFSSGNYVTTNNTVDFNSTGAQTIPALGPGSYNNLTISGARTTNFVTLVNGGTIRIRGVFSPTATFTAGAYIVTGNTVEYNGTSAQTLPSAFTTYNNLTLNNAAGTSGFAGLTVNGLLRVQQGAFTTASTFKDVQIDLNATLAGTNGTTMNVSGSWFNNGGAANSFTANGNTVNFNGSAPQTISGSTFTTFNNLTIANAGSGVSLAQSQTVNGLLTLTNDLTTGTNTITMPASGSSGPASGAADVVGNVTRTGFVTGGSALSFGNPNNTIQVTAGTAPANIAVNLAKSVPTGSMGFPNAVQRTYTITPSAGGFTGTLRLHYLDSELNGNTEVGLILRRFNGVGWAPVTPTSFDTTNNWLEKTGVTTFSPWTMNSTFLPTASNGSVTGRITDTNGAPIAGAVINLTGGQSRKTITDANGNYHFDNVETDAFYTVTPSRANFVFSPANRSFTQTGNKTEAAFTGSSGGDTANPLDTAEYFVRQQYVDVLSREPDEGGFNYWSDQINACGSDAACIRSRRIGVAAAFFVEEEFQKSGSFIYDMYKGALGRRPVFVEYASDRTQVIGGANLDAEKAAFANSFVQRAEFVAKYQSNIGADSFVDALLQSVQTSGVDLSGERTNLISTYNSGASAIESRAAVVRAVADNAAFKQAQYNPAFVLTEYFAYLSRDIDQGGYDFWLNVLNNREPGNFRGMVCAFITSSEYQHRFSAVVSHSNGECAQ